MSIIRTRKLPECKECPFYSETVVWGRGSKYAPLMIVTDYPRDPEIEADEPIAGPVGDKLREFLLSAGIPRQDVYITCGIKCRPPENVGSQSKTMREAADCCKRLLDEERKLLGPEIIFTTGEIPFYQILGKRGISDYRGVWYTTDRGEQVLPTFSLMSILRGRRQTYSLILRDVEKIAEKLEGRESTPSKTKVKVIKTLEQARKLARILSTKKVIAFDTETTGLDPETGKPYKDVKKPALNFLYARFLCWSFATQEGRAYVLPFLQNSGKEYWSEKELKIIYKTYKKLFEKPGILWVLQHAMFDLRLLARIAGVDIDKMDICDIMLAQVALDETRPYDLDSLAAMYTTLGSYKQEINRRYLK